MRFTTNIELFSFYNLVILHIPLLPSEYSFLIRAKGLPWRVFSSWARPAEPPAPSNEAPRPGYYTGGIVEFIVTPGGEITRFYLADLSLFRCSLSLDDRDAYLLENKYSLQGENSVEITYAADGKFYINYSLTRCGTRRVWFERKGSYIAEWVSESPSAPRKARGL